MLKHSFNGTPFTIGIEEELMICDAGSLELAPEIERIVEATPKDVKGYVKPELHQSVLEVATLPCANAAEAGAQLADLRTRVREVAGTLGMVIGAAGTHPSADYAVQPIVEHPRYRELIEELRWIARRELIFGTHIHIGIDDADKAIYVADGMRGYLPLLLGMSSNSPLWRGNVTRPHSQPTEGGPNFGWDGTIAYPPRPAAQCAHAEPASSPAQPC